MNSFKAFAALGLPPPPPGGCEAEVAGEEAAAEPVDKLEGDWEVSRSLVADPPEKDDQRRLKREDWAEEGFTFYNRKRKIKEISNRIKISVLTMSIQSINRFISTFPL
jgi:hypothetical protein